jgi:vancomycin permeability regulator SanA
VWARPWARRSITVGLIGSAVGVLCLAMLVVVNLIVVGSAEDRRYSEVAAVPERPVAIVFGAGVNGSNPSPALASRLDGAIALYDAGTVDHLLMSGDNGRADYDEVTVMRDYALARGVPGEAITRDYAGFDTYDTCSRARQIFGVRAAVLVTQDFHLARALYTCDQLGVDVVGLAIPDWNFRPGELDYGYTQSQEVGYTGREWLARGRAFFETNLTHPGPAVLGPYEGLTET